MTYLSRLQALIPESDPATVEKIVSLLQKEVPSWEIGDALGLGENSSLVLAVKQVGVFLVQHRFQPVELPTFSDAPARIVDAMSPSEQLEVLSRLSDRRAELLRQKVHDLV